MQLTSKTLDRVSRRKVPRERQALVARDYVMVASDYVRLCHQWVGGLLGQKVLTKVHGKGILEINSAPAVYFEISCTIEHWRIS